MLMERFRRAHPARYDTTDRCIITLVLAMQMASHATERRFYRHLLTTIGVPFASRATVLDLEVQALRNLKRMEVRLLMLDEGHNILAGSAREQRVVLNTLRYVSNELKISLVCLRISEAREVVLPRWQGDEEFQELVMAILRHLPLKLASQISARALRNVLQVTDGVTVRVFGMFNDLAIEAIVSGADASATTGLRPGGR